MPYIHWEAHGARKNVSSMIAKVKKEAVRSGPSGSSKPLWPREKADSNVQIPALQANEVEMDTHIALETTELEQVILDSPDLEEDYLELLRRYLYKRRPVHLRRTLDQYYYSHLADTNDRDLDQVVMRQFNEDKKELKLGADPKYEELLRAKAKLKTEEKSLNPERVGFGEVEDDDADEFNEKANVWQRMVKRLGAQRRLEESKDLERKLHQVDHVVYYDDNSPVLMIDQLWMWIIDESSCLSTTIKLVYLLIITRHYCDLIPTPTI
jgi:hypothetical protein